MQTLWENRYAQRTQRISGSIIRELLKLTEQPGIISFAGGLPAPDVFPVERVAEAAARVLSEHGAQALQYGTTEGYKPLRELLAEHTAAPLDNYLAGKLKGGSTGLGTLGSCHALVEIVAITRDII